MKYDVIGPWKEISPQKRYRSTNWATAVIYTILLSSLLRCKDNEWQMNLQKKLNNSSIRDIQTILLCRQLGFVFSSYSVILTIISTKHIPHGHMAHLSSFGNRKAIIRCRVWNIGRRKNRLGNEVHRLSPGYSYRWCAEGSLPQWQPAAVCVPSGVFQRPDVSVLRNVLRWCTACLNKTAQYVHGWHII